MAQDSSPSVADNAPWSGLDHFDEDVCARVRSALLDAPQVRAYLLETAELTPNESLGYWQRLEELERLSDGFLTAQQGQRICERLCDADEGKRPRVLGGVPTLWGALPPASDRDSTGRKEGRRRWPQDATIERALESLLARFPEPHLDKNAPGASATEADDLAAGDLSTSSVKVARHRLRRHLPRND